MFNVGLVFGIKEKKAKSRSPSLEGRCTNRLRRVISMDGCDRASICAVRYPGLHTSTCSCLASHERFASVWVFFEKLEYALHFYCIHNI